MLAGLAHFENGESGRGMSESLSSSFRAICCTCLILESGSGEAVCFVVEKNWPQLSMLKLNAWSRKRVFDLCTGKLCSGGPMLLLYVCIHHHFCIPFAFGGVIFLVSLSNCSEL